MDKEYEMAKVISRMTYLELMALAKEFLDRTTNGDYSYDLTTQLGWAELLAYWADFRIEEE